MTRRQRWRDRAIAIGSGLWMAVCLPMAFPLGDGFELFAGGWTEPLALFGLVPLISRLRSADARWAFRLGWWAGVAFFAASLFWLDVALTTFGHLPRVASVPILFLLVGFLSLFWALPSWAAVRLRCKAGLPLHLTLPVLWGVLEFARNYVLTGFSWASLGTSQARSLWLAQLASLGGVYLVAYAVVAVNAAIERLWAGMRGELLVFSSLRRGKRVALFLCLGLMLTAGWGLWRLNQEPAPKDARKIVVGVVQGNLDEKVRLRGGADQRWVMKRMLSTSRQAVDRGARLVVWPEGSLADAVHPAIRSFKRAAGPSVKPLGAELVIGGVGRGSVDGRDLLTNSAFLVDGDLRVIARYDKRHLVPFGEYVPLGWLLPWEWFVPKGMRFFDPGPDHKPIELDSARVGMLICYEAIFPEIARASVNAGAELLVNITNDSWYGPSSAPFQHLAISRMRSIETGRYQVRAANTGLSAIIDSRGRILKESGLGLLSNKIIKPRRADLPEPTYLTAEVALLSNRTPYLILGDLFAWVCVFLSLLWIGPGLIRRR